MEDREAGLAALNEGRVDDAIALLQKAATATPDDGAVFQYLAVAQSRSGNHAAAVESITRAVTLDPGNAQARFNMALVLNQAGWPEQAMQAAEQAITLRPDYSQASQLLDQLRAKAAGSAAPPAAAAAAEPTIGTPTTGGVAPSSSASYSTPPSGAAPPGGGPIPLVGGASPGGLGQQPLPGSPPAYGAPPAMPRYLNVPAAAEDRLDLMQALRDCWAVTVSPVKFFAEQVGREGKNAPYAAVVVMSMAVAALMGLGMVVKGQVVVGIAAMVLGTAVLTLFLLIASYIGGGLLHMFARLFGGSGTYDGSYRVAVYSNGPRMLLSAVGIFVAVLIGPAQAPMTAAWTAPGASGSSTFRLIPAQFNAQTGTQQAPAPGQPTFNGFQNNPPPPGAAAGLYNQPVYILITLFGLVWWFIVAIMGMARVHALSVGAAFASVLLAALLPFIILFAMARMFASGA